MTSDILDRRLRLFISQTMIYLTRLQLYNVT